MTRPVRLRRALALAPVLVVALAVTASADVTVQDVLPQGDGTTALVLALRDGCATGTTGVAVEVPDGSAVVDLTAPDGWRRVLDGPRAQASGPAVSAGDVAELILTTRIGAQPGDTVDLVVEQSCADGTSLPPATVSFAATADVVDPGLTVREAADVPPGADGREVAIAIAVFAALSGIGAGLIARRSRRS